ncbi:beta-1,3-glucan-binding protein [Cephus cinctus]|uniref:Beta-1,3-glucan-binding protein n=1 Tax=Cephus cinctus TaxID=211228 RepID=A0AAJ7FIV2_CEPCN|nr:beta-1,3-glucan-binding protein [Cephus cinctus]
MNIRKEFVLFFIAFLVDIIKGQYTPPLATVVPIHPKGIRISIPDEEGITLVAFHVKINEDFNGLEAGTIARDIVKARNGLWTYEDKQTQLHKSDIVYYWIHVVYKGLGYNLLDQQYVVNEFYNFDGTPVNVTPTDNPSCVLSDTRIKMETGELRQACSGELIFDEQFENIQTWRWHVNERFSGAPDYEFVVYTKDSDNVQLKNGILKIQPTLMQEKYNAQFVRHGHLVLENCTEVVGSEYCHRQARGSSILPPVLSGRLDTKMTFNFIYGRIEIRAKLPRGDWIYPLLTLDPLNPLNGELNPPQMRIAYSSGNQELRMVDGTDVGGRLLGAGGIDALGVGAKRWQYMAKKYSQHFWSNEYHTYELEWRQDRIIVKVDGTQYGNKVRQTSSPFDKPYYLTIGVAVGGYGEFADNSTSNGYRKPWRNIASKALFNFFTATNLWHETWKEDSTALEIDYIKIWAL